MPSFRLPVSALRPQRCRLASTLVLALLLFASLLAARPAAAQPTSNQPASNQPASAVPHPVASDSFTTAAQPGTTQDPSGTGLELPTEPGFHDIADRFYLTTRSRVGRALYDFQKTSSAPYVSVVTLEQPEGDVADHTQRIFESCCTGTALSRAESQADSAEVAKHGNVLLVVYADADTIGIAADARGYEALPRETLERIVRQEMMTDGRYVESKRSVHAGLTAIVAELGADEQMMQRVSVDGPPTPRDEAVQNTLLVLAFFFAVLFIPGVVVSGVVTVMESSGCLRHLLYFLAWVLITVWTIGTLIGVHDLLGEPFGADVEQYLIVPGGVIGFVVYLIINGVLNRWLDNLSRDDQETWKHTLRGGAAVGAGAGAVGNLVRSAAAKGSSGFGGFGGGGFGGGGAGGSFQAAGGAVGSASASGAASSAAASSAGAAASGAASSAAASSAAASSAGAAASGAGAAASGAASGAASAAAGSAASSGAVSTASVSGGAVGSAGVLSGLSAKYRWRSLRRQLRKFRWYHYVTFAIVAYVFYQIATYALWALQFKPLFWIVAVPMIIYAALQLWDRWGPDIQERVRNRFGEDEDEDDPDFPGDHAMARW